MHWPFAWQQPCNRKLSNTNRMFKSSMKYRVSNKMPWKIFLNNNVTVIWYKKLHHHHRYHQSFVPTLLGSSSCILFLHYDLSWAKSLFTTIGYRCNASLEVGKFCIVLIKKWMEYLNFFEVNRGHLNMIKTSLAFLFLNPLPPLGGLSLFSCNVEWILWNEQHTLNKHWLLWNWILLSESLCSDSSIFIFNIFW